MSSTIHRFTPPTCTLEIEGNKSPLSRWTRQKIFKKIQFKLRFDDPRQPTSKQITISGKQQDLLKLKTAVDHYTQSHLSTSFQPAFNTPISSKTTLVDNQPYLKSQGLVHHQLFFGSLIHDGKVDRIRLSTVQLFDLVSALEAYQSEIATLPETKPSSHRQKTVLWSGIAAGAIAVISIPTIIINLSGQQNIATSPESQPQAELPELDDIIPPPAPETATKPTPKPKSTKTLTSANRLPPPPAVDTPKPKPDIPDPADYSLSDVARQSGLNNFQRSKTNNDQAINDRVTNDRAVESTIVVTPKDQEKPEVITQENTTESNESNINTATNIPSPSKEQDQVNIAVNSPAKPAKNQPLTQNDLAALNSPPPSQIQQVIAYFENQWQPPENLKQSLEYRLLLNPDGSIRKIIPLGKASQLYLSQTNIPLKGESFMSPPAESQSSRIRLLLNPDGNVQAFVE